MVNNNNGYRMCIYTIIYIMGLKWLIIINDSTLTIIMIMVKDIYIYPTS